MAAIDTLEHANHGARLVYVPSDAASIVVEEHDRLSAG